MTRLMEAAVIELSRAQGPARSILITLASLADERREIALGMHEIARIIDRHPDTARYHVRKLRADGELEVVRPGGGRKPNMYRISDRYARLPDPGAA